MGHSPAFLKVVDAARKKIKETGVAEVAARLKRGEKFLLIDTREDGEWAAGRIPGAVHLGKGIIERDIEATVADQEAEIVLYCGGGFRSALAAASLQEMGYSRVVSMDGGFRGWVEAGGPVEK
jgi:rhodanese-related sulfurtransferase